MHIQQLLGLRKWIKSPRGFFSKYMAIYSAFPQPYKYNTVSVAIHGGGRTGNPLIKRVLCPEKFIYNTGISFKFCLAHFKVYLFLLPKSQQHKEEPVHKRFLQILSTA